MKKNVLINISYIVEIEEKSIEAIGDTLDKIMNKVSSDIIIDINKELKWESTSSIDLEPEHINCGRCQNCGGWVTDREKANPIKELCNGATYKGKLLCDECLPSNHRWAF